MNKYLNTEKKYPRKIIRMRGSKRMREQKGSLPKIYHTYPTIMNLVTIISYIKIYPSFKLLLYSIFSASCNSTKLSKKQCKKNKIYTNVTILKIPWKNVK